MRRISCILLFANMSILCKAQLPHFEYESISNGNLNFPIFSNSSSPQTAEKINQYLQLSELGLLKGHERNDIFEQVTNNGGSIYGTKRNLYFRIIENSDKVLSLMFDETSCGATCAYWNIYYNFNAGNGDRVLLNDLFTQSGFELFKKQIIEREKKELQLQSQDISAIEKDNREQNLQDIEDNKTENFFIRNDSIIDDSWNSDSRNRKFGAPYIFVAFALSEFKNYLNDYGKALFGITTRNMAKFRSKELPQLFSGTIEGRHEILLIIRKRYERHVDGIYAYLKIGTGINLDGEIKNDSIHLIEKTANFDDNGYIDAVFNGETISGSWADKGRTKTLKFEVHRK